MPSTTELSRQGSSSWWRDKLYIGLKTQCNEFKQKCPESRVSGAKNLLWNRNLRIGILNVRTLAQSGSLESLKMDLKKYNLEVLGVQETRLEEQEIDLGDHKLFLTDSWLSTAKSRQGGVGIAVTKRFAGSIIEQIDISERVAYVKFAAQRRANLVVIVWYAPTNEADNLAKDNFWNQLSSLVSSFKQRERVCLVGDFNAEPNCKRRFETARGCKVHEARFCKSKNSKRVEDRASNLVGLEKSLTCQKCTRKFAAVKGRRIHESQYCGREEAGRSRIFSCNVHDRDGVEFENVEAFMYLGSFVSLQHDDLKEISVKLAEGRQRFASFQKLWKSKKT